MDERRSDERTAGGSTTAETDASEEPLNEADPAEREPTEEPQARSDHDDEEPQAQEPRAQAEAAQAAGVSEDAEGDEAEAAGAAKLGPGEDKDDATLVRELCALLFAAPDPLSLARLVDLLERPARARVRAALDALDERLAESGLPLTLRQIAGGYRLMTAEDEVATIARLVGARKVDKISPAGLETLAIVAYRQPVTKAEIEAIRGVQAGPVLRSLVDRGLVRVSGRADQPGAPLQYGTTKEFLDRFGLAGIEDLPRDAELVDD